MKKIVVLFVMATILTSCKSLFERTPGEFDVLAKCLTEKGIIMYGADTCPHCQEQKKRFRGSFDLVKYIECRRDPDVCKKMEIEGYPTWIFPDGKKVMGAQSLSELSELSGCALN